MIYYQSLKKLRITLVVFIEWKALHQNIISILISKMKSPEDISPDFNKPFSVHFTLPEASETISYASHNPSSAEKDYHLHNGKLNFFALKWAVPEMFRGLFLL